MAKQTVNQGAAPTGVGGDTFRSGSAKLQANDDELYTQLGASAQGVLPAALPISKGGTGAVTAAAARTALGLTLTETNSDSTVGRVLKVGDFGVGLKSSPKCSSVDEIHKLGNSFFSTENNLIEAPVDIKTNWSAGIKLSGPGTSFTAFLLVPINRNDGPVLGYYNSVLATTSFQRILTTGNTTKDSNGFLKSASPVVQLFSNEIKLNDEATQQPIIFEKLGTGDYIVKGSLGFAQEGWYIEQPKDANGNVLVAVVYKQLENNDISVKTYKKKFDLETASIVADLDKPVDIPDGRWIDLRLQELPQPEVEEPISNTPPDFQPTGIAAAVQEMMYGTE